MNKCKTCKYYDETDGSIENWGICEELAKERLMSCWSNDIKLFYESHPDFGCVLWEGRKK